MSLSQDPGAQRVREYLNEARGAVLWKCADLSEAQARQEMTATGSSIIGIVHHLTATEYAYFGECLGRVPQDEHMRQVLASDDPQAEFTVPKELTLPEVCENYRRAIAFAEAACDELEPTTAAEVTWWVKHRHTNLARLVTHMFGETARHAGHIDILREQLDGFAGLYAHAPNLP
ncbi:DinB family protein [Glutamicibacter endophyticus]